MTRKTVNALYFSNQPNISGGAERSLLEILENLDPLIVKPFFASAQYGNLTRSIIDLEIPFYKMEGFKKSNPFPFLYSSFGLMSFIKKNKIDVIHNNQCSDTFYTLMPSKLTNTPIIIHHRDSYFSHLDKFFIKNVDCNICISNWQNNEFLDGHAILIHNGINLKNFENKPISAFNKPDKLVVGLVGSISPIKGQDIFIKAANIILKRNNDIHFLIIGDTKTANSAEYVTYLRQLIQEFGIENNVEFFGYVNGSEKILHEIDISVDPSIRQAFGRVMVESMASAKPVIATSVGGALDIVTPQTGILIPANDHCALADAIQLLIDNPEMRRELGIAGRERAEKTFSINNTLKSIYKLYEDLVDC